ncbi:MAG: hypothetical protein FWF29_05990 [Treponema sp.]|nr:hypothetical protein [Treponema sp.]
MMKKAKFFLLASALAMGAIACASNQAAQSEKALAALTPDGALYEAEDAQLFDVKILTNTYKYTGKGYVGDFSGDTSAIMFNVDIAQTGQYDLIFMTFSPYGGKENYLSVNGEPAGSIHSPGSPDDGENINGFRQVVVENINLRAGKNTIKVSRWWGWCYFDSMTVVKHQDKLGNDIYNVSAKLSNPNADDNAKRLMKFLADSYGKMVLTGQYGSPGDSTFEGLKKLTGSYPAVMAMDMIDYSPSRIEPYIDPVDYFQNPAGWRAAIDKKTPKYAYEESVKWDKMGGIVALMWHWNAPAGLLNTDQAPWFKGFYTYATTFDMGAAINNPDSDGYKLLVRDIDFISDQLKPLCDAGIPVLWRPLHEAGGGAFFWWDNFGPDAYVKLWKLMYDRMTKVHNLTNLIWVWNGGGESYYPGDDYVDMAGLDMYQNKYDYSSQYGNFSKIVRFFLNRGTGAPKIIGIMEDGVMPDIDFLVRDNAMWSMFLCWSGDDFFIFDADGSLISGSTESQMIVKTYTHKQAYTLNNLPNLKNYPLE